MPMLNYPELYRRVLSFYPKLCSILPGALTLPPLHTLILTTYRCNVRCSMCPYLQLQSGRSDGRKEMDAEEIKRLVDRTASYGLVTFTGGELLVRRDILDILGYAASRRKLSVITNGTLLTPDKAEALAGMGAGGMLGKGLVLVGVSLEGPEEFHDSLTGVSGSYKRTTQGIRDLLAARKSAKKKYPLINLQTVITPDSVGFLEGMYRAAGEMGIDMCNFAVVNTNPYHNVLDDNKKKGLDFCPEPPAGMDFKLLGEQLDALAALSKESRVQLRFSPSGMTKDEIVRYFRGEFDRGKYSCFGPWAKAQIDPYGDVLICPFFRAGNVREDDFRAIWKNVASRGFRRSLMEKGLSSGCAGCCMLTYLD